MTDSANSFFREAKLTREKLVTYQTFQPSLELQVSAFYKVARMVVNAVSEEAGKNGIGSVEHYVPPLFLMLKHCNGIMSDLLTVPSNYSGAAANLFRAGQELYSVSKLMAVQPKFDRALADNAMRVASAADDYGFYHGMLIAEPGQIRTASLVESGNVVSGLVAWWLISQALSKGYYPGKYPVAEVTQDNFASGKSNTAWSLPLPKKVRKRRDVT